MKLEKRLLRAASLIFCVSLTSCGMSTNRGTGAHSPVCLLYAPYQAIARPSVNAVAGSAIDLAYGVVLVFLFVPLRPSLPGQSRIGKALASLI